MNEPICYNIWLSDIWSVYSIYFHSMKKWIVIHFFSLSLFLGYIIDFAIFSKIKNFFSLFSQKNKWSSPGIHSYLAFSFHNESFFYPSSSPPLIRRRRHRRCTNLICRWNVKKKKKHKNYWNRSIIKLY